jgi:hypothetical protein
MKVLVMGIVLLGGCLVPTLLPAQVSFKILGHEVQAHGFLSEGFALTDHNNYLRMRTSNGSSFVEAGVNASAQITERLRIGAQAYDRHIGELGKGRVYLDWALVDYRWRDWLGIRAGKVKTTLGLYTDTQDQEFLHTWALLPQAVYPADLRSVRVAHVGGDIYGHLEIRRGGSVAYTVFGGSVPDDPRGGFHYGLEAVGAHLASPVTARMVGFDLRWNTPVSGLTVGTSFAFNDGHFSGTLGASRTPLTYSTKADRVRTFFGEYTLRGFHAEAEVRTQTRKAEIVAEISGRPVVRTSESREPTWFLSGAYRFSKWFEAGTYYSHYRVTTMIKPATIPGSGVGHIYDKVVAARFDLTAFWDFKVEGHFMDGVGSLGQGHGFYPQDNPAGFRPTTNMLILRTGLYF